MSSASSVYRSSPSEDQSDHPPADPTQPAALPLHSSLKLAFQKSLDEYGIRLRFFSGSWENFDFDLAASNGRRNYDVVLTSETIYRADGLTALVSVLRGACHLASDERSLDKIADKKLSLSSPTPEELPYLCLVSAKILYFGVGGGVSEFVKVVQEGDAALGKVEMVWEKKAGVGRKVMRVIWH